MQPPSLVSVCQRIAEKRAFLHSVFAFNCICTLLAVGPHRKTIFVHGVVERLFWLQFKMANIPVWCTLKWSQFIWHEAKESFCDVDNGTNHSSCREKCWVALQQCFRDPFNYVINCMDPLRTNFRLVIKTCTILVWLLIGAIELFIPEFSTNRECCRPIITLFIGLFLKYKNPFNANCIITNSFWSSIINTTAL